MGHVYRVPLHIKAKEITWRLYRMSYKDTDCNNLDEAKAIIKSLKEELDEIKKQLELLRKRNTELENLYITDELTGLFNQGYFFKVIEEEIERNRRQKHPLCLLFIDVDNLKAYNDAQGHAYGDEILKIVAQSISQSIRKNVDSGYRYGGDEFAVILPEVHAKQAFEITKRINRILQRLSNQNIQLSCGISELISEMDSKALFIRSDEAMYIAKKREGIKCNNGIIYKIYVYQ
jgi:two-component system cell cycle response regulator